MLFLLILFRSVRDSVQKPSSCTKDARGKRNGPPLCRGECGHRGQAQGGRTRAALDRAHSRAVWVGGQRVSFRSSLSHWLLWQYAVLVVCPSSAIQLFPWRVALLCPLIISSTKNRLVLNPLLFSLSILCLLKCTLRRTTCQLTDRLVGGKRVLDELMHFRCLKRCLAHRKHLVRTTWYH